MSSSVWLSVFLLLLLETILETERDRVAVELWRVHRARSKAARSLRDGKRLNLAARRRYWSKYDE